MLSFLIIFALSSSFLCEYYVGTFAGSGFSKYEDGQDVHASFTIPTGVAFDAFGNLFVADNGNNMIRKINSTGYVTTVAGDCSSSFSDGQDVQASFNLPSDVAVDLLGNIFVSDNGNNMIRKINATGYVSTLAGPDNVAPFNYPTGLTIDLFGNIIVADSGNNIIRSINSTGCVSTVSGSGNSSLSNGQDVEASFYNPNGVAVDIIGNIFVADSYNNQIRKINTSGYVSTFAGNGYHSFSDGQGIEATFDGPIGIEIDSNGNLFVTDSVNQRIRKINSFGYVNTIAGTGNAGALNGPGSAAVFNFPQGITIDANGIIFVADSQNSKIRSISPTVITPSSITFSATKSSTWRSTNTIITPTASSVSVIVFPSATETNTFSTRLSIVTTVILQAVEFTIDFKKQENVTDIRDVLETG